MQRRTFTRTILIQSLALLLAESSPLPHLLGRGEPEPWLGTWNLQLPKVPDYSAGPRYKRVTSRIESRENGLKVTYEMVGIRGGVTHLEWAGKFDGKDYPLQGADNAVTHAYRKIDDHSYEIVIKNDGALEATARVVVASDGKQLHVATEGKGATGQIVKSTAIYDRL